MRAIGIGKRPRERTKASADSIGLVEKVTKLESKVDKLKYVVGLV